MTITAEPAITETPDTTTEGTELEEKYAQLLVDLGFTPGYIPTAAEVKEKLDARKVEIRQAVLDQSDSRGWCDDGTRKVLADLRLSRPGSREQHTVRATVTLEVQFNVNAYNALGAARLAHRHYLNPERVRASLSAHSSGAAVRYDAITVTKGDEVVDFDSSEVLA